MEDERQKQEAGIPENAFRELKPGEEYIPVMRPDRQYPEVTPYSVIMGLVMAIIFSAAAAYLGLKVGQVFEAAIPIAIIAVGVSGALKKKNALGQNVIIQSIGASSGIVVAGAIFTLPALYILQAKYGDAITVSFIEIFLSSMLGGVLGVLMFIPFRKYFVSDMHGKFPFPEATATTQVLISGEKSGSQVKPLIIAGAVGGIYDFLLSTFGWWAETLTSKATEFGAHVASQAKMVFKINTGAAVLGLGYIVGLKYCFIIFAGSAFIWYVIVCNIWGKGMVKILPILIGVLVSYAVALVTGAVDFQKISEAAWLGIPLHKEAMGLFAIDGSPEFISALFTIIPIALATMMEHVGDIAAISATVGHNYINDPGLNRTLMGDGLATTMAGLLGGPANTTYGENTGVLALSKIYDPLVIRIAAVLAIILSFSPKFEAVINTIPTGIIGGISFVLYGMISAIGVRNVVENRVDFTNSRNLIVAAVILVCALGFNSVGGVGFTVGSVTINLSGLAVAAIAGILLNAILPGNDYEFDATAGSDAATSGNLQV